MNPAANNRYCWRYTLLVTTLISLTGCVAPSTCTPQTPHAFNVFWSGMTQTGYYWDPRFVGQPDPLCAGFHTTEWSELDAGCGDPLLVGEVPTESLREPEPSPLQNETEPAETLPEPKSGPDFPDANLPITRNHTDTAREPLTLEREPITIEFAQGPGRESARDAIRSQGVNGSLDRAPLAALDLPEEILRVLEPFLPADFDVDTRRELGDGRQAEQEFGELRRQDTTEVGSAEFELRFVDSPSP